MPAWLGHSSSLGPVPVRYPWRSGGMPAMQISPWYPAAEWMQPHYQKGCCQNERRFPEDLAAVASTYSTFPWAKQAGMSYLKSPRNETVPLIFVTTARHGKAIPCGCWEGGQSCFFTHRNEFKWLWGKSWLKWGGGIEEPIDLLCRWLYWLVLDSEFQSQMSLWDQQVRHFLIWIFQNSPCLLPIFRMARTQDESTNRTRGEWASIFSLDSIHLWHLSSLLVGWIPCSLSVSFSIPWPTSVTIWSFFRTAGVLPSPISNWTHGWPWDISFPVL